jgi:ABC-type phosphate transport system permease subunit
MKAAIVTGVVLVILGVISLAYQGISYTHRKQVFKAGPISATKKTREYVPLPPILGVVAVAGGAILIAAGSRAR